MTLVRVHNARRGTCWASVGDRQLAVRHRSAYVAVDLLTLRLGPATRDSRALGHRHARVGDVARLAQRIIGDEFVECVLVALADASGRVLGVTEVARGARNTARLHPQDVLRPALLMGATGVVLAHNHPSGSVRPSNGDVAQFLVMENACHTAGLHLLDSLVVTSRNTSSVRAFRRQLAYGDHQ